MILWWLFEYEVYGVLVDCDIIGDFQIMMLDVLHQGNKQGNGDKHDPSTVGKFGDDDDDAHYSGYKGSYPIDEGLVLPFILFGLEPVAYHADLGNGEGKKDADRIKRYEEMDIGLEYQDEKASYHRREENAVGKYEACPSAPETAGHEGVGSEDGEKLGQTVVSGIGSKQENDGG